MEKLTTMEALSARMGQYTKMEDEIAFDEFIAYYNDLLAFLQAQYQDLDQDELVRAKGMTMIVAGNARMRALRKDANRKKFAKMADKAKFWEDAIALRLKKEGLDPEALEEKVSALWA